MDAKDRELLNELQLGFPLSERPFALLAEKLALSEEEVMRRVKYLKEHGVIREIGAIFDGRALGYKSCLVAMCVDEGRIDEVAALINRHAGVSHNYRRDHAYNLWFTLAVPGEEDLERTTERLAQEAGVERYHMFHAPRVFKIGVFLDMVGGGETLRTEKGTAPPSVRGQPFSEGDKAIVRALQGDLPIVSQPFLHIAESIGIGQEELLRRARGFLDTGVVRRYCAVLRHRRVGFVANGMACWRVPSERIEEVGRLVSSFPEVSHCYERSTYWDWPYNLFSMIHARSHELCQNIARKVSKRTGIEEYIILFSTKEYKKERLKYFGRG